MLRPALKQPRGYPRLVAICDAWIDYIGRDVFPGGCFFAAASFEFDGRPGLVRDAIAANMHDWIGALEKAITIAKEEGHLRDDVDPAQLAFELNSLFFGANFDCQLRGERKALDRARRAIQDRLAIASQPQRPARRRTA